MPTMKKERNIPTEPSRKSENPLRQIPTDVLQRAKTIFSIGSAKSQGATSKKQDKFKREHLKACKSEPEFQERACRKSRTPIREDDYRRARPMSVGPCLRRSIEYDDQRFRDKQKIRDDHRFRDDFEYSRRYDSSDRMDYLHPRLTLPVYSDSTLDGMDSMERPRKKLSFREPEIVGGHNGNLSPGRNMKHMGVNSLSRSNRYSLPSEPNGYDHMDSDLESQAMRIVRTVGQAFEVCHKISSNNSEPTASGSACEDAAASVSDVPSDLPKKEAVLESGWEPGEVCESSTEGASTSTGVMKAVRPQKLELLPPPPRKENRRSPQRTVTTPNIPEQVECVPDLPAASSIEGAGSSLSSSTPVSAQHELQLLKERLEQQSQQTRAAVAQLLLLRDQLAAEQAARCEAQARTHQLLVHNKELIDHITALVAHLQERERGSRHTPISSQQLTMVPQMQRATSPDTPSSTNNNIVNISSNNNNNDTLSDNTAFLELLTQTPIRTSNQNLNNNNFKLSSIIGTPTTPINGINTINPVNGINTFNPVNGVTVNNPFRNVEQIITQFQAMTTSPNTPNNVACNQQFYQNCNAFPAIPPLANHYGNVDLEHLLQQNRAITESNINVNLNGQSSHSPNSSISHSSLYSHSPVPTSKDSTPLSEDGANFIMPLSHSTTLTATDADGRTRLIVPISPSGSTSDFECIKPETEDKISVVTLNVTDESGVTRRAMPTRTTSEKVPNKSERMEAMRMQRTRHTTKE